MDDTVERPLGSDESLSSKGFREVERLSIASRDTGAGVKYSQDRRLPTESAPGAQATYRERNASRPATKGLSRSSAMARRTR